MRTFGSTTRDLVSLREWLRSEGCTHVVGGDAGIGALIGALAGGGKGAAIGAVAGDGFGTPGRKPLPMVRKSNCLWKLC